MSDGAGTRFLIGWDTRRAVRRWLAACLSDRPSRPAKSRSGGGSAPSKAGSTSRSAGILPAFGVHEAKAGHRPALQPVGVLCER